MSKYTIELRYVLEIGYDFGLNDYPIFDETYRQTLNNNIINTFYFSEICEETVARWAIRFKNKMNVIMPYYNKLYESQLIEIDPLSKIKETKSIMDDANGNNTTTSKENLTGTTNTTLDNEFTANDSDSHTITNQRIGNSQKIESDTPQAILSVDDIESNLYASNAQFNKDNITDNGTDILTRKQNHIEQGATENKINNTNTSDSTSQYTNKIEREETTERNINIPQSELLKNYRESFINIDKMILDELKPLFMCVF